MQTPKTYATFREFYEFYLAEHANRINRRLHFSGSVIILFLVFEAFWQRQAGVLVLLPVVGYGFAWVGHFFFEKNRPATFKYPFYSLAGDWLMFFDILRGRVKL